MWINWTEEEAFKADQLLRASEPKLADAIKAQLEFIASGQSEDLVKRLRDKYCQLDEGDLDFDDEVAISEGDAGAYVLAWLWLTNDELGIESKD